MAKRLIANAGQQRQRVGDEVDAERREELAEHDRRDADRRRQQRLVRLILALSLMLRIVMIGMTIMQNVNIVPNTWLM